MHYRKLDGGASVFLCPLPLTRSQALDNLSRGNLGALLQLSQLFPNSRFRFVNVDLGNAHALLSTLQHSQPPINLVMHFAALAYVGGWRVP